MLDIQAAIRHCDKRLDVYDASHEIVRVKRVFLARLVRYARFEGKGAACRHLAEKVQDLEAKVRRAKYDDALESEVETAKDKITALEGIVDYLQKQNKELQNALTGKCVEVRVLERRIRKASAATSVNEYEQLIKDCAQRMDEWSETDPRNLHTRRRELSRLFSLILRASSAVKRNNDDNG